MDVKTGAILPNNPLPRLIEPSTTTRPSTTDLIELILDRKDWLNEQVLTYGGILLRGFTVADPDDFERVSQAVIPELKPYVEGQSPRTKVKGNVYTSTEYPAQYRITLHNELSYAQEPPRKIIFCCHTEPGSGGETPIVDCRVVYQKINPQLREKFETKGVKYVKNMHGDARGVGKSWMEHFETSERTVVERYLHDNEIEFEWTDSGSLRTVSLRSAVTQHPVTGETVWFNQANLWHISNFDERQRNQMLRLCGEENLPTHAYFGDGTPILEEELDHVRDVFWSNAAIFPWQQGDVLVLDNTLVAHGRMAYEPPRRILVAMG